MQEIHVESSNIATVAYEAGDLYVRFKGGTHYKYLKVPQEKFDNLLQAESKGKFLNAEIKSKFDFEKLS